MSHNDRARPASQWTTYAVPDAHDLALWDRLQFQGLNGDLGGNYAPATPIVIGGAGLALSGSFGQILGGVTTQSGGRLWLGNLGAGPGDEVRFTPSSALTRRQLVMPVAGLAQQISANDGTLTGLNALTNFRGTFFGALAAPAGSSVPPPIVVPIPSRYLHNGATILSGPSGLSTAGDGYFGWRLTGRLLLPPTRVPATILSANILWVQSGSDSIFSSFAPITGLSPTPPQWTNGHAYSSGTPDYVFPKVGANSAQTGLYYKCTTSGTSAGSPPVWPTTIGATVTESAGPTWTAWGYGSLPAPAASTIAGYYQAGAPQTIRISPQTDTVIDTTQNAYFLEIQPDTCGVGWLWTGMQLSYTSIANLAFE